MGIRRSLGAFGFLLPVVLFVVADDSAAMPAAQDGAFWVSPVHVTLDEVVGRVVNADDPSRPVASAMISIVELGRGSLTDRAGQFRLDGLPPGTYTLRIRHMGYGEHEQQVTIPIQADLVVYLEPQAVLLDAVVATASPYSSPVAYQPVQAFNREDLQRRSATSLGDMLDGEPGVAMSSFGNVTGRPVIRGLGYERVLVLENGERMGDLQETGVDHAITTDPLMVDRVEVVRGPASVLYGSQALGGVVNVLSGEIPRTWPAGLSGSMALQGASVNRLGAGFGRAVYGGDRWAATARASYRESGEIRTPDGPLTFTQSRTLSGGAGLSYSSDRFKGGLSFGLLDLVYGIPQGLDEDEAVEIRTERRTAQARGHWQLDRFFNDVEMRLHATRYWQEEWELDEVAPGVYEEDDVELGFLRPSVSSTITLRHGPVGPFDRGAFGTQLFYETVEAWGEEALTPDARRPQFGLFSFQDLPLGDRVRLQFGARVDLDRVRTVPNERFPDADDRRAAATVSGSVGAHFSPVPDLELGLQLSRAHRSPMIEELYIFGAHIGANAYEIGNPDLNDELGHGLDFIVTGGRGRVSFESALFYKNIRDYIIFQPTGEVHDEWQLPIFKYEADRAVLRGFEAVVEAELVPDLHMRLSGDYVRGNRTDGTPLPFMTPARASLALTRQMGAAWVGTRIRAVAAQNRVAEEEPTAGYTLLGFEAGYRVSDSGVLTLRIDNALDKAYRDHLTRIRDRNRPMPGRNINIGYRWLF